MGIVHETHERHEKEKEDLTQRRKDAKNQGRRASGLDFFAPLRETFRDVDFVAAHVRFAFSALSAFKRFVESNNRPHHLSSVALLPHFSVPDLSVPSLHWFTAMGISVFGLSTN